MKLEYKEYTHGTVLYSPTQHHAILSATQRERGTDYTTCIIQNKVTEINFLEHIVHMQVLSGDIFDRLINRSLVAASYDEPLLCNHF